MKLVVTIFEPSPAAAIVAIRNLTRDHDAVELRVDPFGAEAIDLRAVRAATPKPLIVTNRGGAPVDFAKAFDAGIDFVDVELGFDPGPRRDRVVLSHHDYAGPSTGPLREMLALGCAQTKLAVTPRNYDDNVRLLELCAPGVTVIGMGERGLYARILAPFLGSELQFVAASAERVAAPGQLMLDDALAIYGERRDSLHADAIFAVAGNPSAHSRSPMIHNPLFREHGVAAAYAIASFETFAEIAEPFARGDRFAPRGLSVTAPFKDDAFAFAERIGATIAENARDARAVNTLVRMRDRIVADNTDVDGFAALIPPAVKRAAIVGAGGTARAARVALARAGVAATLYNRTPREGALPIDALASFDGDLVVNTLPLDAPVAMPAGVDCITAAYGSSATGGLALLRAQAVRQNALFLEACR